MMRVTSLHSRTWLACTLFVLRSGGIVVYPTDTVYGMGCDATNKDAVGRLVKIKQRIPEKPFPLLISDFSMAKRFAKIPDWIEPLPKILWPGPWTFVVEARRFLPRSVSRRMAVGLRIPDHHAIRTVISKLGKPIIGTSANIAGLPPARSAKEAFRIFSRAEEQPDLIVDGGRLSGKPSTVIRVSSRGLTVLRN